MLTSLPTDTTLVHVAAQSQKADRFKDVVYEAVKESLRAIVRCSDVFPPLKSAGQAVLEIFERHDAVKEIPQELERFHEKLCLLIEILKTGSRDRSDDRLAGLARTFGEKARVIAMKLDRSMAARIIETTQDLAFIAREISSVTFAIDIAMMDVNLRTYKGVSKLQETVSELKVLALLDKLKYVEGAGFNHEDRQGCTNGTRIMLLGDLLAWSTDPAQHHVFWLNGMAGTGKTTVAETLCNLLAGRGYLGSSFFCSRKKSDRRNVRLIFPALAKALAQVHAEFRSALVDVLKNDLDFTGMSLDDQYLTLILEPAKKAFASAEKPVVVAIDALDECEDNHAAEMFLKAILGQKPLCFLKFFITSRPEPKIFKGFSSGIYSTLRLQDIEQHVVNADIAVYLNNKLKAIDDLYEEYSTTWPPSEVNAIVNQSGSLFIYAATVAKYIADEQGDPVECLSKFASISPPLNAIETIDEVYSFILTEAFSSRLDVQEKNRIKACLSVLICALEPLPLNTYAILLGITVSQVKRAFISLNSVVQVPENKHDHEVVLLYHASFPDYLTSPQRSAAKPWLIDTSLAHQDMAHWLINVMMEKLHFNISKAITSYASNVDQYLTLPTFWIYTSISWANHALYSCDSSGNISPEISNRIKDFLTTKFLSWLEVLSILERVKNAPSILLSLTKPFQGTELHKILLEFSGFISTFLLPIQHSTPHIYLSALAWVSSNSVLGRLYQKRFRGLPKISDSTHHQSREHLVLQLLGHTGEVTSVEFSPDGQHIVSASKDRSVCIWDAHTGNLVMKPLKEHTAAVNTIAYSPNGLFLASGSQDNYIKIWDALKGKLLLSFTDQSAVNCVAFSASSNLLISGSKNGSINIWRIGNHESKPLTQFKGHTDYITSVAFSPNTQLIASGSGDWKLGIWEMETGNALFGGPLKGHTDVVTSVKFTSTSQHIISGSEDNLIYIWEIESGQRIAVFRGHTNRVTSIALSLDDLYLASGSQDKTVHVWRMDSTNIEAVNPIEGHTNWVTSVALSPDSLLLASASSDKTIKVWNIESKGHFLNVVGHTDYITSVSISPDNKWVASGSRDDSVIVWDRITGEEAFQMSKHSNRVTSIAYSADGQYFVSGSRDKSLILWDATVSPYKQIRQFEGHTDFIHTTAFSSDGKYVFSGSADYTIRRWSIDESEEPQVLGEHMDQVSSIATLDKGCLASGSVDKTVCIWDIPSKQKQVFQVPDICLSVALSNNGEFLAAGLLDSSVVIWSRTTGQKICVFTGVHTDRISTIAFSPNNKYLACGSRDTTISIWNIETQRLAIPVLQGHAGHVTSVVFSSDGNYLVSGGHDSKVRIWKTCLLGQGVLEADTGYLHNCAAGQYIFEKDGWIKTANQDLVLWVPPNKLPFLYMPQSELIMGFDKVTIDFESFCQGNFWCNCLTDTT